jgi:hypothetical protein
MSADYAAVKAQRDELLGVLIDLDERLRQCFDGPITAKEAYDSFYQEIVAEAIQRSREANG